MFVGHKLSIVIGICLLTGLIMTAIAFSPDMAPYVSQTLPNAKLDFFGRDKDMNVLLDIVSFSNDSFRFVNIIGPPGFGKSALAINIGHKMLARRTEVHYINLMDFPEEIFKQILAERILMDDDSIKKGVTFNSLLLWGRRRWWSNCLIILDNCDDSIKNQTEDFHDAINKLLMHSGSNLKLLTTSRELLFHSDNHFVHKVHPIDAKSAGQVLEFKNPTLLSDNEKRDIAQLTGEVPLALKIVGALLSNKINSPTEVIENLKKQPIDTLSPSELQSSMRLDASISLSYNYLDKNMQEIGHYLSFFTCSFDQHTALHVLHPLTKMGIISQEYLSLKNLVKLSLLEYDDKSKRYYYHKLIKDYFISRSDILEYADFMFSLKTYFSHELCKMADEFVRSPRAALLKLDLDRHHIQLLMSSIIYNKHSDFDPKLVACFLKTLKTRYLYCRFTLFEISMVLYSFVNSFLNSIESYLSLDNPFQVLFLPKYMAPHFIVYVELLIELSKLRKDYNYSDIKGRPIIISNGSLGITDMFCTYSNTEKACRKYYSHILSHYEDQFDVKKAKLYHIKYLEKYKASQIKCKSANTAECNYIAIAESYINLKKYNKAKIFFEKALYDETYQYSIYDRLYMLLWLRNNFKGSINLKKIENELDKVYHTLLNLTAAQLYGGKTFLIQSYQDYLIEIGEHDKACDVQERWIQAMEEIGVMSTPEQINLARETAIRLYNKGKYNRSLSVVNHILAVVKTGSNYVELNLLKGSIMYKLDNFSESEKFFKVAIDSLLIFNITTNSSLFSKACWNLMFHLHNFDYIRICYTNDFVNVVAFYGGAVLYVILKSPFDPASGKPKSPKKPVKVDIPLEYFPSLFQQSHRTDLISNEAGEVFLYKPDFGKIATSALETFLFKVENFCSYLFEINILRLAINFSSIFTRLILVYYFLSVALFYLIKICSFKLFVQDCFYFYVLIIVCVKTK